VVRDIRVDRRGGRFGFVVESRDAVGITSDCLWQHR
jgi:hypothetical protein